MIVIIRFNADKKEKRMKSIDQWPNKIIIPDILLQNKEEVNGKRFLWVTTRLKLSEVLYTENN